MKRCEAKLYHGPGHQSSTRCELLEEHDVHCGEKGMTGAFDEPPNEE